eukprot:gene12138-2743_t
MQTHGILNNRPLTYLGEGLEEEAITPNHLIFGRALPMMPEVPEDIVRKDNDTVKRFKHVEAALDRLWQRWSKKYLLGLREHHKPKKLEDSGNYDLKPGDIVLIEDNSVHREIWRKAIVRRLIKGRDNVVRGVEIGVIISGHKKRLERALQHVFPLEMQADVVEETKRSEPSKDVRRSTRVSSMNAKARISMISEGLNQSSLIDEGSVC